VEKKFTTISRATEIVGWELIPPNWLEIGGKGRKERRESDGRRRWAWAGKVTKMGVSTMDSKSASGTLKRAQNMAYRVKWGR